MAYDCKHKYFLSLPFCTLTSQDSFLLYIIFKTIVITFFFFSGKYSQKQFVVVLELYFRNSIGRHFLSYVHMWVKICTHVCLGDSEYNECKVGILHNF
jgi:hypothetical protein